MLSVYGPGQLNVSLDGEACELQRQVGAGPEFAVGRVLGPGLTRRQSPRQTGF